MPSPSLDERVRMTIRGIRRVIGTARRRKTPSTADVTARMASRTTDDLVGRRDRALLLLGFAGAFRRTELVGLNVEDVRFVREGLVVEVKRSKTDQEAHGESVAILKGRLFCPVAALRLWLDASRITKGPIFRAISREGALSHSRMSDRAVTLIVKRYAILSGMSEINFSAHSLRSGFLTSAAANGASIFKMMDLSRHKSIDSLRTYIRDADLFRDQCRLRAAVAWLPHPNSITSLE